MQCCLAAPTVWSADHAQPPRQSAGETASSALSVTPGRCLSAPNRTDAAEVTAHLQPLRPTPLAGALLPTSTLRHDLLMRPNVFNGFAQFTPAFQGFRVRWGRFEYETGQNATEPNGLDTVWAANGSGSRFTIVAPGSGK